MSTQLSSETGYVISYWISKSPTRTSKKQRNKPQQSVRNRKRGGRPHVGQETRAARPQDRSQMSLPAAMSVRPQLRRFHACFHEEAHHANPQRPLLLTERLRTRCSIPPCSI